MMTPPPPPTVAPPTHPLLDVAELRVTFATERGPLVAVDGVTLEVAQGETLGLVGESGSGKSVTSLAIMGLLPSPAAQITARRFHFEGVELLGLSATERRAMRGRRMAMVFQDPMTSLNPYLRVYTQLAEVLAQHTQLGRRMLRERCIEALREVGIPDPGRRIDAYPHELSGGMRQRVLVAMATLCRPALLLADEPTTALDVTIQAQILDIFRELVTREQTALVLVTHDLGVVAGIADRVAVMYAGQVVELASAEHLFARPSHPYTQGLLQSIPRADGPRGAKLFSIVGAPPNPMAPPAGCRFHPRCTLADDRCRREPPPMMALAPGHGSACWYAPTLFASPREVHT